MTFYVCLMLILAFTSINNIRSKSKSFFYTFIIFALMAFKHHSIGNDTLNYIELFQRLKRMGTFIDANSRFEKGYQIYTRLIGIIFNNYQALFIVTAFLCSLCILYGIRNYSINWQYSLFLFVGLRFFNFFLSGLRQSIAISIIFVSYNFLRKRKYSVFLLLVLLASTFHFTAIIFVVAIPLSRWKVDFKGVIRILMSIIIVYLFLTPLLNSILRYLPVYYSHYMYTDVVASNNLANYIGTLLTFSFFIFVYFSIDKAKINSFISSRNSETDTQLLFLLMSVGLSLIATRVSILDRMIHYFWIFSIVSIPNAIFTIKNKNRRMIWFLLITMIVIIYNIGIMIFRPEWSMIIPYKFFWQK